MIKLLWPTSSSISRTTCAMVVFYWQAVLSCNQEVVNSIPDASNFVKRSWGSKICLVSAHSGKEWRKSNLSSATLKGLNEFVVLQQKILKIKYESYQKICNTSRKCITSNTGLVEKNLTSVIRHTRSFGKSLSSLAMIYINICSLEN